MRTYTLREVADTAQAAIEGLSATAHVLPDGRVPTWRHSDVPLTWDGAASALNAHLLFSVTIERATSSGAAGADYYQVEADVVVVFGYKVPAGAKVESERKAMDAAHDVARAMLRAYPAGSANVDIVDLFVPGALADGDYLPVEQRYRVVFDSPYQLL